jgi:hypothetical protein
LNTKVQYIVFNSIYWNSSTMKVFNRLFKHSCNEKLMLWKRLTMCQQMVKSKMTKRKYLLQMQSQSWNNKNLSSNNFLHENKENQNTLCLFENKMLVVFLASRHFWSKNKTTFTSKSFLISFNFQLIINHWNMSTFKH